MARARPGEIFAVLNEARRVLGMTQRAFGYAVGSSHRTAARWAAKRSWPADFHLRALAALLYPHDAALAAVVADHAGESLQSLGLEAAPPPVAPPPPPVPTPPTLRVEDLVDLLVLAAVEATGTPPALTRIMLHAVFKRARDLGLTVEVTETALRAATREAGKGTAASAAHAGTAAAGDEEG
jgi:hypothetical protein